MGRRIARLALAALAFVSVAAQAVSPGLTFVGGSVDAANGTAFWCGASGPSAAVRAALADLAAATATTPDDDEPQPAPHGGEHCATCPACGVDVALAVEPRARPSGLAIPTALGVVRDDARLNPAIGPPVGGRAPPTAVV